MALSQNTSGNRRPPGAAPLWVKGVSANPGGRPKSAVLRAMLEPHRRDMVATLLHLMRAAKDATRLEAVKLMLAYLDGRPDAITLDSMSDETLLVLLTQRIKDKQTKAPEATQ